MYQGNVFVVKAKEEQKHLQNGSSLDWTDNCTLQALKRVATKGLTATTVTYFTTAVTHDR